MSSTAAVLCEHIASGTATAWVEAQLQSEKQRGLLGLVYARPDLFDSEVYAVMLQRLSMTPDTVEAYDLFLALCGAYGEGYSTKCPIRPDANDFHQACVFISKKQGPFDSELVRSFGIGAHYLVGSETNLADKNLLTAIADVLRKVERPISFPASGTGDAVMFVLYACSDACAANFDLYMQSSPHRVLEEMILVADKKEALNIGCALLFSFVDTIQAKGLPTAHLLWPQTMDRLAELLGVEAESQIASKTRTQLNLMLDSIRTR